MKTKSSARSALTRWRKNTGAVVVDNFYRVAAHIGRLHPLASPKRYGIEHIANIDYAGSGSRHHHLDLYIPRMVAGPWPVVIYAHGGGFRVLSKDTHWLMALAFARAGYLVANLSYRLAPRYPFPAAHEDVAQAYRWVARHAKAYGGDLSRVVVAGESAGANLALSLAIMTTLGRPEPFAQQVFETGLVPKAAVVGCGILQVSDTARFARRKRLSSWVNDRVTEVEDAYLGPSTVARMPGGLDLANPLQVLESTQSTQALARPFPAVFAPVGTKDPILDDTRRLKSALDRLQVTCDARYYPGQVHAFFAYPFLQPARQCWRDIFSFLEDHV